MSDVISVAAKKVSVNDLPAFGPGSKFTPPNLGNWTPQRLVDEIGNIRKWKSLLDSADKFLSEALKARTAGELSADGEIFHMSRTTASVTRIVPDLVREHVDAETLAKVSVSGDVTTMRFDWK